MRFITLFCYCCAFVPVFASVQADSLIDRIRLVSPRNNAVITQNSIRLLAAVPPGAPVREVRFYAAYKTSVDSIRNIAVNDLHKLIGSAVNPPFETFTDLSSIPDQDEASLVLTLNVVDSSGRFHLLPGQTPPYLTLDRKPGLSNHIFTIPQASRALVIDGRLDEWTQADSVVFTNGDNRVRAFALWDKKALYFGIEVTDNTITGPYPERGYLHQNLDPRVHRIIDTAAYVALSRYDEIELFFNINGDRNHSVRNLDDRHLLIGAKGAFYGRKYDRPKGISELWGKSAVCAVFIPPDSSRYSIEISIPWMEFSVSPEAGLRMAFDLFSKDNVVPGGPCVGVSWNGAEYTNYNNPSEWGQLELTGGSNRLFMLAVPVLVLIAAGLIILGSKRRTSGIEPAEAEPAEKTTKNDLIVQNIEGYVNVNYTDPELNMAITAKASGISAKYAGSLFKAYKNISFSQYLNNLRLAKAKELLQKTDKNITEITFEIGYASPDYFTKVFKTAENMSPSEFRLRSRRPA